MLQCKINVALIPVIANVLSSLTGLAFTAARSRPLKRVGYYLSSLTGLGVHRDHLAAVSRLINVCKHFAIDRLFVGELLRKLRLICRTVLETAFGENWHREAGHR
jgi:hypothetical protein